MEINTNNSEGVRAASGKYRVNAIKINFFYNPSTIIVFSVPALKNRSVVYI